MVGWGSPEEQELGAKEMQRMHLSPKWTSPKVGGSGGPVCQATLKPSARTCRLWVGARVSGLCNCGVQGSFPPNPGLEEQKELNGCTT